jgi:S1-C subfamily serine protease
VNPVTRFLGLLSMALVLVSPLEAGIELREAATLVQPAVVHVQARFHARVLYSTASGSTTYGPYEKRAVGSGVVFHDKGLVLTNTHVVEAGPDLIEGIQQYFMQSYVASIQKDSGRSFSEGEISRLIGQIRSQGTISLIDDDGEMILDPGQIPREVVVVLRSGRPEDRAEGRALPAEVAASSGFEETDLTILRIAADDLPTASLGSSQGVRLGDEILILSYTRNESSPVDVGEADAAVGKLNLEMSEGSVSSIGRWKDGTPIFGTDATVAGGSSGGPAINESGEVIGLLSMGSLTADRHAYGFNYLRPIDGAIELIGSSGFEANEGDVWTLFGEALHRQWQAEDLENAGEDKLARAEYRQALDNFYKVLELCPHHPDAHRHIAGSEAALRRLPQSFEIPTWLLGLGGGLLLLVSLYLLSKKRRSKDDTKKLQVTATAARERNWTLVGESGPLAGNTFAIEADGLVIGRDPSKCQVVYQGETISRQHARIRVGPGGLLLTNLSTTNRTYLNDQPIQQTAVREGDRIRVGQAVLRIEG